MQFNYQNQQPFPGYNQNMGENLNQPFQGVNPNIGEGFWQNFQGNMPNIDENFMQQQRHTCKCQCHPGEPACDSRVINRCFECEVPHVCNLHTHIINHLTRRHVYYPCYTTSEENRVYDVYENQCGF